MINTKSAKSPINKQPTTKQDHKMDQMLMQLRELISESSSSSQTKITPNPTTNKKPYTKQPIPQSLQTTKIDIQSILWQSSKLIQTRKQFTDTKPTTKAKILAASQLLKDQNDLVKSYVKEKIQSELFSTDNFNDSEIKDYHLRRLQQQRQQLIEKKRRQVQQQTFRRQQLISRVRQFDSDSRVNVDVHEINSLIFKQQPESGYLLSNMKTNSSKEVRSISNQLKTSSLSIGEVYQQHEVEMQKIQSQKILERDKYKNHLLQEEQHQEEKFVQIQDEVESYHMVEDRFTGEQLTGVKKVLNKNMKVVKILAEFLKNQWAIMKINNTKITIGSQLPTAVQKFHNHQWKNQKIKPPKNSFTGRKQKQTLSVITQNFKFKPMSINEQSKVQLQRQKVSQHRINKMIGESAKFHTKKCILTKNELIYFEEKDKQVDTNKYLELCIPETTKHLQLEIQRIVPQVFKKQQGSFFSKKETQVSVVQVKGKTRNFIYEYDFLEGKQLTQNLKTLMAHKVHVLGSKVNGENNIQLSEFIHDQNANEFSLSMIPLQLYTVKEDREKHLAILVDSLIDHKPVSCLNLSSAKLLPTQITLLLKQCRKLNQLTKINLSNNKINKQNFLQICQFVNDIKIPADGVELVLKNCRLDDECFLSNVGVFTSVCGKVKTLDLSGNVITSKTVQILKSCMQNVTSTIKHLYIDNCPIRDLSKLNALLKQSRKLQSLSARNCSLYFDQKRFQQLQKFFDFLKLSNTNLKRINLSENGALTRKQYAMIQNLWYQLDIEELVIDLDLEMVSDKGEKELKRMDNHYNSSKNLLTMRAYRPENQK